MTTHPARNEGTHPEIGRVTWRKRGVVNVNRSDIMGHEVRIPNARISPLLSRRSSTMMRKDSLVRVREVLVGRESPTVDELVNVGWMDKRDVDRMSRF